MASTIAILPDLALIPAGRFCMGDDAGRADERPAHPVEQDAFYAAVAPVTNAEYAAFVRASGHEQPPFCRQPGFEAPDQPVVGISWFDAVAYCDWLSSIAGRRFRLPTEAEREYAA